MFCGAGKMAESIASFTVTTMAWFSNHYRCARCGRNWTDEWSCMCDDDCPHCGARHMTPADSDDLTTVIERNGDRFLVLWSPEAAERDPAYRELGSFATRDRRSGSSQRADPAEAWVAVNRTLILDYIPLTHSPRAPSGGVRFGGVGAAPAPVLRNHGSGRPRVTARPNYVGLPARAGRGRTNGAKAPG
jgi:DNA-directed RNA polymerase subunit RPC12/RpoP